MENKLVKLLAQFYALDQRGKFQFCKESEEACNWVNASSTREIDCRSVSRKPWTNAMTWIKSKSLRF